jgi:thioredoxin reductase
VLVLDEAQRSGEPIYARAERWMEAASAPCCTDAAIDAPLRAQLADGGAEVVHECCVWHVGRLPAGDGSAAFEISTISRERRGQVHSAALIVATGAREPSYPRPGWTLPGVFGLGDAMVMLQTGRGLPGSRIIVVGPGERARSVASLVAAAGGHVVADIDPNDGRDASSINGSSRVESVTLGEVDSEWRPLEQGSKETLTADAVCIGYGLSPACEIYQLLGGKLRYAPALGGWIPILDRGQRTDVPRLYGAGDSAGVLGTESACNTGRLAALSAAFDLDRLDQASHQREVRAVRRVQSRIARAGSATSMLAQARSGAMAWVPDDTIACRCESIRVGELRAAIAAGAREINALKSTTRCGMGPCGGRVCEEAAAALLECAGFAREKIGKLTARAPLRPLPIAALTGTFKYSDIPFPQAADT